MNICRSAPRGGNVSRRSSDKRSFANFSGAYSMREARDTCGPVSCLLPGLRHTNLFVWSAQPLHSKQGGAFSSYCSSFPVLDIICLEHPYVATSHYPNLPLLSFALFLSPQPVCLRSAPCSSHSPLLRSLPPLSSPHHTDSSHAAHTLLPTLPLPNVVPPRTRTPSKLSTL